MVLIITLASLAYLITGLAIMVVFAAKNIIPGLLIDTSTISHWWYGFVFIWPAIVIGWSVMHFGEGLDKLTMHFIRKLNPKEIRWK